MFVVIFPNNRLVTLSVLRPDELKINWSKIVSDASYL